MQPTTAALIAALAFGGQGQEDNAQPLSRPVLPRCLVELIEEAQVPSRLSGVLESVDVREGMRVEAGDVLAQIDDTEAQLARDVAKLQSLQADRRAENDVDIRFARASSKVAKAELDRANNANEISDRATSQTELDRLRLTYKRSQLQIEQAEKDQKDARLESQVRAAELEAGEDNVHRHKIKAPISGTVVQAPFHRGEWVRPGDPVARIVRMDRLRVVGLMKREFFFRQELKGRPVYVNVSLPHGRTERFSGKITFVSPLVEKRQLYRVIAEVENHGWKGEWLLEPGMLVEMTLDIDDALPAGGDKTGSR